MTINELLAMNNLTANDQIPVWDAEATGSTEPTAKITAQNFANAVKSLASLIGTGDLDAKPTQGSTKAVQSGGVFDAIKQSTALEDISANISSTKGTFNVKIAYKLLGIAVIVFELKLTSSVTPGVVIMSGIPYPKGRYVNIIALNNQSPVALYTDGTNLVSNANVNTGNTLAGSMVYVVN